jgi:hypothetical protein
MAWFGYDQIEWEQGWWWAHNTCNSWYTNDSTSTNAQGMTTNWQNNLQPCPCTLNQSYVDFGRFVPTPDCNLDNYNKPGGCPRNQGAVACFQSTNITSFGSSNRCCYNRYGYLMYSGDATNGSLSQRADPWGLYPYNTNPNIPSISDWEIDILPYYYCCMWQTNYYDCFSLYMTARPTQDCKNYDPPGFATAFGDPHFITMDGTLYTFNAWGEFWLLDINNAQVPGGGINFAMQARFQQPFNQSWGQIKATVMTAVAMQINNGTIVTVMTNLYSEREHILVYVNSTLLNFTYESQYWQQYPDFIVVCNDRTGAYGNFTVIWRIGIGVNIGWANGVLELYATIPPEFMRVTGGLFGYWNGNPQDDLMPRGSTSTPVSPSDPQQVFYSFGMTWIVQPQETIFTYAYRASLNYYWYRNTWFIPSFTGDIPPNGTVTQAQISAVCYSDTSCQYDYAVTENQTIAVDTHAVTMWDAQRRTMGVYATSCGWLNIPYSIRGEPPSYMVGSQVTILGCMPGFKLWGTSGNQYIYSYSCQSTGYESAVWSPNIDISCVWLNYKLGPGIQAAVAVPLCILAVIGILAILYLMWRWHRQRHIIRKARRERRRGHEPSTSKVNLMQDGNNTQQAQQAQYTNLQTAAPPPGSRQPSYNNIVTGTLNDSYLDRASRSSTPSKVSVHTGLNLSVVQPPVAQTPSRNQYNQGTPNQGQGRTSSRPITPANINYAVVYNQNPNGAAVSINQNRRTPSPAAYQYPANQQNRGQSDYYNRRYAPTAGPPPPPPQAPPPNNDSEV